MANRVVRDGILDSDAVNKLSWQGEVFYRRLMSVADDYGRGDGRISIVRSKLFPLKLDKVSEADIVKWMHECVEAELVSLYQVDNKPYFEILNFNQSLRIKKSKYPANPNNKGGIRQIKQPEIIKQPESENVEAVQEQKTEVVQKKAVNLIDQFFIDLPNSAEVERMAMLYKVSKESVISKIPSFRTKAELSYPTWDRFVSHFKNWYAKEGKDSALTQTVKKRNQI